MAAGDVDTITAEIHAIRRQMIDITAEISRLIANKNVSLRSEEYVYLKEKYYNAKFQIKNLQSLLEDLQIQKPR
jgi:hypothetical protein